MGDNDATVLKLIEWIGEIREGMGEMNSSITTLTDIARTNRACIDELREMASENKAAVSNVTRIVTNGLQHRVEAMFSILDKRKTEREGSLTKFLDDSWHELRRKWGWIVILLIGWVLLKTCWFGDFPKWFR